MAQLSRKYYLPCFANELVKGSLKQRPGKNLQPAVGTVVISTSRLLVRPSPEERSQLEQEIVGKSVSPEDI